MIAGEPWSAPLAELRRLVAAAASFADLERLWPEIERECRRLRRRGFAQWRGVRDRRGGLRCDTRDVRFKLGLQGLAARVVENAAFSDPRADGMRMTLLGLTSGRWKPAESA